MSGSTVLDEFRKDIAVTESEARHILAGFLFFGAAVFRRTGQLSGGERMRLQLAKLMHQDLNLLILDEPTNHLDIDSREVLEEALENFKGSILAVSHDRYLLNRLFDQTYWIEDQRLHYFPGRYSWARAKLKEMRALQAASNLEGKTRSSEKEAGSNKPLSTEDIAGSLENRLQKVEAEMNRLSEVMEKEESCERLMELYNQQQLLEAEQEQIFAELEKLS